MADLLLIYVFRISRKAGFDNYAIKTTFKGWRGLFRSVKGGVSHKLAIIKSILIIVIYIATNNKLGEENRINKGGVISWLLT